MKIKFSPIFSICLFFTAFLVIICLGIIFKTYQDIQPINVSLKSILSDTQTLQVTDRKGRPLSISYQNRWNTYDNLPLYQIPEFLKTAFLAAEDQYYYEHSGVDWRARMVALMQNIQSRRTVRGASTITEQVVRMIHPRPRHFWSKWIEGFEAGDLEKRFSKADIFEFYLNQVPYAANRRGVLQAAHYYFDRDLSTLTKKEMLALAVLARAPSSYDLYQHPEKINRAMLRLAEFLMQQKQLTAEQFAQIKQEKFYLQVALPPVDASHFVGYVRTHLPPSYMDHTVLRTTLDANVQNKVQLMLDQRVKNLNHKGVRNGAALVVDHTTGEIVAWVVAGAKSGDNAHPTPSYKIDAVTVPRQPGSALKPFLYALALQSGWTPATLIDDSPYSEAIGTGWHRFKNYSNGYYGKITLREALGNSLNIPALHTIRYVGTGQYLQVLHALGFISLNRGQDIYDEGLALGNGEVSLLELTQGYTALANRGVYRPLRFLMENNAPASAKRIFSSEAASLIANILSDAQARRLEFGENSVLNLPVQTAVKTGTSTDYRDAWTVGFNYRYVVGIWMGNLDHTPTNGVTGVIGPALTMRSIFSELNKYQETTSLYLSPKLISENICVSTHVASQECMPRTEYFISGTQPSLENSTVLPVAMKFVLPTPGLQIAIDPRVPHDLQQLKFQLSGVPPQSQIDWMLNGMHLATTDNHYYLWDLEKGNHRLSAVVNSHAQSIEIPAVEFVVK